MDFFEKRIELLKSNIVIFEKYAVRDDVGIVISDDLRMDYEKRGREILCDEVVHDFMQIRSIYCQNIVQLKLKEYTFSEWYTCLCEKILLVYALPIFSRVILFHPALCGMNHEWESLLEITKIESGFWDAHSDWKSFFVNRVQDVLSRKEDVVVDDAYVYQFMQFVK